MPTQAPVLNHLCLYEYWLAKRGSRMMPARRDLDPGEIVTLLPYLMLIDQPGDQFRYRLMGSAIVREIGRDLTGTAVGSYLSDPKSAADVIAVYRKVFATAQPVFVTGKFCFRTGAVHKMSMLALPLSADSVHVSMAVATLVSRFDFGLAASRDWLKGMPVDVSAMVEVGDAADLEKLCVEWERNGEPAES